MSWPGFRLVFFVAVLVHGLLAGALYALLALAFVVVCRIFPPFFGQTTPYNPLKPLRR